VAPGVATRILPRALLAFGKRNSRTRIVAVERTNDAPLFDLVREGAVEIALAHLPAEAGPFDTCPLLRTPWVLLVPAGAEIAKSGRPPSTSELARLPLVIVQSPRTSPSVEARLRAELGNTRVVFRSNVAQTAQALAAAGVGRGRRAAIGRWTSAIRAPPCSNSAICCRRSHSVSCGIATAPSRVLRRSSARWSARSASGWSAR
jgi:hypothetical protein